MVSGTPTTHQLFILLSDTLISTDPDPVGWRVPWSGCLTTSRTFSATKLLGEHQGENIALFLQAVRVCLERKGPRTASSESFENQLDA